MNDEDTDEPMEFEDLNKALQADTTDEKHRKRMEQLMKHRPLKEIYEELKSRQNGVTMNSSSAIA